MRVLNGFEKLSEMDMDIYQCLYNEGLGHDSVLTIVQRLLRRYLKLVRGNIKLKQGWIGIVLHVLDQSMTTFTWIV